jgi:penicillin-binding protein 2
MGYKASNVEAVRSAVAAVTVEGTARGVFMGASYQSAGKTGTAQAVGVRQNEKYNASRLSEYQRDHSLYIAYAPVDNPTIALAVIVENAGFGAAAAAPIARRVMDYWLLGRYPSEDDMAAMRKGQASTPIGPSRNANDIPLPGETLPLAGLPVHPLPDYRTDGAAAVVAPSGPVEVEED